ncbi:MAG: response regulator transcription factor [Oligoflexia bacterium]|nr:response regulator transcription factor [Oligoflexia bacterium]
MSAILLVEDERDVKELILLRLTREGHEVDAVENGEEALRLCARKRYSLAIVDWMLPGISGLELCRKLSGQQPILMVTARADAADIVLGLETGADDYVTKPFEIPVLLARVRALLRRGGSARAAPQTSIYSLGALCLDAERHAVNCGGAPIDLTPSEFRLLFALLRGQGKVLSRQRLIEQVQGDGVNVTDRTIDTHIFGLRKKLGACGEFVETIRGVGYRIKDT